MKPRRWNNFILFFLFSIFLIPLPAYTQVYKWIDEKGNTHFTDDYEKIPGKFRNKQLREYRFEKFASKDLNEGQMKREEKQKENGLKKEKPIEQPLLEEKKEKKCGECRIVSVSLFKQNSGVGAIRGSTFYEFAETCASIGIKNDSCKKKYISNLNVFADVIIKKERKIIRPKGAFALELDPGETYQGSVCFGVLEISILNMYLDDL